jgi:hypothetical protein
LFLQVKNKSIRYNKIFLFKKISVNAYTLLHPILDPSDISDEDITVYKYYLYQSFRAALKYRRMEILDISKKWFQPGEESSSDNIIAYFDKNDISPHFTAIQYDFDDTVILDWLAANSIIMIVSLSILIKYAITNRNMVAFCWLLEIRAQGNGYFKKR